jgi:hypothetical protein
MDSVRTTEGAEAAEVEAEEMPEEEAEAVEEEIRASDQLLINSELINIFVGNDQTLRKSRPWKITLE